MEKVSTIISTMYQQRQIQQSQPRSGSALTNSRSVINSNHNGNNNSCTVKVRPLTQSIQREKKFNRALTATAITKDGSELRKDRKPLQKKIESQFRPRNSQVAKSSARSSRFDERPVSLTVKDKLSTRPNPHDQQKVKTVRTATAESRSRIATTNANVPTAISYRFQSKSKVEKKVLAGLNATAKESKFKPRQSCQIDKSMKKTSNKLASGGMNKSTPGTRHRSTMGDSTTTQCKSILKKENVADSKAVGKQEGDTVTRHVKFKKSEDVKQASLRSKLNDWLEAKGKTPSGCRHLMCFDAQMSAQKKQPKPVYGRLSGDILDKQESTLKKEEVNSRKRLFDGVDNKPSKSPAVTKRRSASETKNSILTPSDISNTVQDKSPQVSFTAIEEKESSNIAENDPYLFSPKVVGEVPLHSSPYEHYSATEGHSYSSSVEESDNNNMLVNLKSMLDECLHLFKTGCAAEQLRPWFMEMEANISRARTFAPFYICKAQIFARNPQQALDILCQAVENNAQPSDVLATAIRDILSPFCVPPRKNRSSASPALSQMTSSTLTSSTLEDTFGSMEPSPVVPVIDQQSYTPSLHQKTADDSDLGSTIKYCVIPGHLLPGQTPDSVPLAKVTPIRRSFRLSNRQQTPYRKELDSVSDLTIKEAEMTIYQNNPALLD